MTNRNYYTGTDYDSKPIPSREEFHRYTSNLITESDFDTDHTNKVQVEKVDSAIKWTIKNSKEKKVYNFKSKEKRNNNWQHVRRTKNG